MTGQLVGTIEYVAPEQIEGEEVDSRTDIYSLGCVLFECLTGEPPFQADQEAALLWAHLTRDPPKASDRRVGVSPRPRRGDHPGHGQVEGGPVCDVPGDGSRGAGSDQRSARLAGHPTDGIRAPLDADGLQRRGEDSGGDAPDRQLRGGTDLRGRLAEPGRG